MEDLSPADLKTILHSKRANVYYLQHCRLLVNGGRVEYGLPRNFLDIGSHGSISGTLDTRFSEKNIGTKGQWV